MYQPLPGAISTTVMSGRMPKKERVSFGWRWASRPRFAGLRCGPAMAASSAAAVSMVWDAGAAAGERAGADWAGAAEAADRAAGAAAHSSETAVSTAMVV